MTKIGTQNVEPVSNGVNFNLSLRKYGFKNHQIYQINTCVHHTCVPSVLYSSFDSESIILETKVYKTLKQFKTYIKN